MLVDTCSSLDILYLSTLDKLQLPRNLLQPFHTPLTSFTGHSVYAMGIVALNFTMGAGTKGVPNDRSKSYCIAHSPEDEIHYPGGIGEICGDQKRARICYQTSVPPLNKGKNEQKNKRGRENHIEVNMMRNEEEEDNSPKERERGKKGEPHQEIEKVPFKRELNDKTFRIGMNLGEKHKQELISLNSPNWIANVVLVKKPNNKWRMCNDFINLNNACPKTSTCYHAWEGWLMVAQGMKFLILWMHLGGIIRYKCSPRMKKRPLLLQNTVYTIRSFYFLTE
ncbi:hypothetical protein LIER_02294 [Lithospermum erythrorhizon]|uniref:Uncharacterized protein n=1 Tax=Lithospermum erythrorhizon TaxID=34254 RepID=A0AAV3NTH9_LITER